jgi:hypothetical protein
MRKNKYYLLLSIAIGFLLIPSGFIAFSYSPNGEMENPNSTIDLKTAYNSEYPIVLCPGWLGQGISMIKVWNILDEAGFNMINFNGAYSPTADKTVSTKAITYSPTYNGWSFNDRDTDGIPESSGYTQIKGDKYKDTYNNNELVVKGDGIWWIAEQIRDYVFDKVTFTAPGSAVLSPSETGDGTWHTPKINLITHSMGGLLS